MKLTGFCSEMRLDRGRKEHRESNNPASWLGFFLFQACKTEI